MQIIRVSYRALFNKGNFSNETIGFTAKVEDGEDPSKIVEQLRQRTIAAAGPTAQQAQDRLWDLRNKIQDLEAKIATAQENWDQTREFLIKQGLKPDAPEMPKFLPQLTPAADVELVEYYEGEEPEDEEDDIPL